MMIDTLQKYSEYLLVKFDTIKLGFVVTTILAVTTILIKSALSTTTLRLRLITSEIS